MKKINLSVIVFVFLILHPLDTFSQKKNTSKKQSKSVKQTKRIIIEAVREAEDGVWKKLVSDEGNFKVLFPELPKKVVRENDISKGTSFIEYTLKTSFRTYSVSFGEFDFADSMSVEQLNEIYDKMRDGVVRNAKGKLLNDKKVSSGSILGREITYQQNDFIITNRYFLKGKVFYQIITIVEKELNAGVNVQEFGNKFLYSFNFLPSPP